MCENADNYPLGKSSQSHVPYFKIGQEIPADVLDWDIKVETDISENKHLEEKEEQETPEPTIEKPVTESVILDAKDNELTKYLLAFFGFMILILVIIFACWHVCRKRMILAVQNKIVYLREQATPSNIIKAELRKKIEKVKYKAP